MITLYKFQLKTYEFRIKRTNQVDTEWGKIPVDHTDEFNSNMGAATHAQIDIVGENRTGTIEGVQYSIIGDANSARYVHGNTSAI